MKSPTNLLYHLKRLTLRIAKVVSVATMASTNIFNAMAMPTADVVQRLAAVVNPCGTFLLFLKIIPPPINPKPVATAAIILATADLSSVRCAETAVKRQAAKQMEAKVRIPIFF